MRTLSGNSFRRPMDRALVFAVASSVVIALAVAAEPKTPTKLVTIDDLYRFDAPRSPTLSSNGRLAYARAWIDPQTKRERQSLWLVERRHESAKPVEASEPDGRAPVFSPDGRWIAYVTNESGTNRIVVRRFPETNKGIWQVPGSGGAEPIWRRDGKEIFYLASDRTLMTVPVTLGEVPQFGQPVALFKTGLPPQTSPPQFVFDVSTDGQHFLLNLPASQGVAQAAAQPAAPPPAPPMTVVVNWTSLLTR